MASGIYAIIHRYSERWYIGQSQNIGKRFVAHRMLLRKGSHHSTPLQRAWVKYGEDAFSFEILILAPVWALDDLEQAYLDDPNTSHFNIARDASAPGRGRSATKETRAKLSAANKGRVVSEETRAKLSAAGRNITPETRAKRSAAQKGKRHTSEARAKMSAARKTRETLPETRAKLSAAAKGRTLTPEHKANISKAKIGQQRRHTTEARAKISAARRSRESKSDLRREQPR